MEVKPKETRQTAVRLAGCVSFFNFNVFPGTTPIYHKSDLLICVSHASKLKFYKELNLRELRRMLQRAFSKCSAVFLKAVFFCRLWWEKNTVVTMFPAAVTVRACVCVISLLVYFLQTLWIFFLTVNCVATWTPACRNTPQAVRRLTHATNSWLHPPKGNTYLLSACI